MMLESGDRRDHVRLQAPAWLALAAGQESRAAELVEREAGGLKKEQVEWINRLKGQLVRK
ncbi:MAG: hypothetical protein U0R19_19025 [Bryobacteraceae bacterium]